MLELAGKDGSESFEDVGHSSDARELMKDYLVGRLPEVSLFYLSDWLEFYYIFFTGREESSTREESCQLE